MICRSPGNFLFTPPQSPLPWIKGLKWGEYVGSPSAPDPVVCFSQPHGERFGSLLALPTRAICGLSRKFCLMMIYSKEQGRKPAIQPQVRVDVQCVFTMSCGLHSFYVPYSVGVRSMHSTDIQWSAILSWGYADNILRLKSKQSEPPINFIQCSQLHQVNRKTEHLLVKERTGFSSPESFSFPLSNHFSPSLRWPAAPGCPMAASYSRVASVESSPPTATASPAPRWVSMVTSPSNLPPPHQHPIHPPASHYPPPLPLFSQPHCAQTLSFISHITVALETHFHRAYKWD